MYSHSQNLIQGVLDFNVHFVRFYIRDSVCLQGFWSFISDIVWWSVRDCRVFQNLSVLYLHFFFAGVVSCVCLKSYPLFQRLWSSICKTIFSLELAVLAFARIMCAYIHSQNGSAILAQARFSAKRETSEKSFAHFRLLL